MTDSKIKLGSKGYYSLQVLDKSGRVKEEKRVGDTENVVTYAGAYHSLISSSLFGNLFAALGTGTTEITRASVGLGAESPGRSSSDNATRAGNEVDNLDGTATLTLSRSLVFSLGSKVGTFSEVGLFTSASGGTFVAGQLIKDEFDNPTTITLLSDEQLIVNYTLEWTVPNKSSLIGTGTITDADSNIYNYSAYAQPYFSKYPLGETSEDKGYFSEGSNRYMTIRGANGTSRPTAGITRNGWSVSHDGAGTVTATGTTYTYSPTSFSYSDISFLGFYSRLGNTAPAQDIIDTTNVLIRGSTGVGSGDSVAIVYKFDPPIAKTNAQSLSITPRMVLSI